MSATVSLKLSSEHDELERITAAVDEIAELEDWPPELVFRINLVLEELGINIMNHGGDVSAIEISLTSDAEAVTIEITDDGEPFDPVNDHPDPDTAAPLEERRIGGLGIFLVRKMMDEMHYRREQGKNHLALTKLRAAGSG